MLSVVAASPITVIPTPTVWSRPLARAHFCRAAAPCASAAASTDSEIVTLAEVEAAARRLGVELKVAATGPAFKAELLWEGGKALPAPRVQTLGYNDDAPPPPELLSLIHI